MLYTVRTVAPSSLPVTLADAKAHCRVEHSEEDALISGLIEAAVSYLDGYTGILGRCLVTQTWRADYADFYGLCLPLWPVASVSSVTYRDEAGATQTVLPANYQLARNGYGAFIAPSPDFAWPLTGDGHAPVSVTAVYGTAAGDVPMPIRQAILLMVADWYRNRETVAVGGVANAIPMSGTVNALLAPYRRLSI